MWLRVEVRGALELWKGELILSRGEGRWERKTYHTGEASASADRRTKQMRRGAVRRIPPARPRFLHPCLLRSCLLHTRNQQRGEALGGGHPRQCFDAGGQGGAASAGAAESTREDAVVRRSGGSKKGMVVRFRKKKETWGAGGAVETQRR